MVQARDMLLDRTLFSMTPETRALLADLEDPGAVAQNQTSSELPLAMQQPQPISTWTLMLQLSDC